MNYKSVLRTIGRILLVEAMFMIPALAISVFQHETPSAIGLAVAILLAGCSGIACSLIKSDGRPIREKEGLFTTAVAWIVVSVFGAIPFIISGEIPNCIDAFFETVSGFTTTGSSILSNVEAMSKGLLYWRSFTHWLGGMGVLVFVLALAPVGKGNSGESIQLLRAESPGIKVDKLVPRMQDSAKLLYKIYIVMTLIQMALLIAGDMPTFDAILITFGTAGTGGFGVLNSSCASYSAYSQIVITVFMILFGINFNVYFFLLMKDIGKAFKNTELYTYLGIILASALIISINIFSMFDSFGQAFQQSAFQVASIISSTGYATANFDMWPVLSKTIIVMLMFIGASAGSTGGGLKVVRIIVMFKSIARTVQQTLNRRRVRLIHMDGNVLDDDTVNSVQAYIVLYSVIFAITVLLISFDGFSLTTNFTAVLSCINNIGPGLEMVGPASNFSAYSGFSKIVLSFAMLFGRLELFPMMALFAPSVWKK